MIFMKTIALIVAGGSGTRFGADKPKQFLELCGRPILMHTIEAFERSLSGVEHEIVVTLPADQMEVWRDLCGEYGFAVAHRLVQGGQTRWHSVKNALTAAVDDPAAVDVVAVHDGVRPLVSADLISRVLDTARRCGSAVPVVMLNDSVRQVVADTSRALDRSSLRAVQTPQVFDARLLVQAYGLPFEETFTDDASVIERAGGQVMLVEGDPNNLKITRPVDLALAEYRLSHA